MNWNEIWDSIVNWATHAGLNLLKAVGFLVVGVVIIKIVMNILNKALAKSRLERVASKFIANVAKFVMYLVLIYIFAEMIGIPMTWFVAITTAASLAISLALEGSISNLANGIILITTKPFKENDFVEIDGQSGSVKEIKILYTILTTSDNKVVVVPNKNVVENTIVNYSANDTRKVTFTFDVAYSSDVERVKAIINTIIINHEKVLLEPTPFIALKALASSSITFTASCWCNSGDYWTVYYDVLDSVFNEFKRENISIPYNQLEVRLRSDEEVLPYRDDTIANIQDEKIKRHEEELAKKEEEESQVELFPGVVIKKPRKKKNNKKSTKQKENK